MSKFAVGEVAEVIFSLLPEVPAGTDVTIVEVLEPGKLVQYLVDPGFRPKEGGWYGACDSNLRKKRPPQDWVKLCKLDSVPRVNPKDVVTITVDLRECVQ